jgi:hypothetical protein
LQAISKVYKSVELFIRGRCGTIEANILLMDSIFISFRYKADTKLQAQEKGRSVLAVVGSCGTHLEARILVCVALGLARIGIDEPVQWQE